MDWAAVLGDGMVSAGRVVLKIAVIVTVVMISIEILNDSGLLKRISRLFFPLVKRIHLPVEAGVPMATGFFIGLTYGAGVIMQMRREGSFTQNQLTVVLIFLGVVHAVVEDTVIFSSLGGNPLVMLGARLGIGLLVTYTVARYFVGKEKPARLDEGIHGARRTTSTD